MTNDDMLYQKLDYIHQNPVERGLVKRAEYWYFSSAGDYVLNRPGPIGVKRLWDKERL